MTIVCILHCYTCMVKFYHLKKTEVKYEQNQLKFIDNIYKTVKK